MIQALQQIEHSISPSSFDVEVVILPPDRMTPEIGKKVEEHLGPAIALSRGRITIEQVYSLHKREMVQVWLTLEGREIINVTVTDLTEFTSGRRALKIILSGGYGSLRVMNEILDKLEEFARLEICASIMVEGRRGWERALPPEYTFSNIVMEKELLQ